MNDYWLYLSKSEMVVGSARARRRHAALLGSAAFDMTRLGEFVRQRVPRGKRLSVWLSGGYCHYVTFPRPRWVFASRKLHAIAAKVFEQKTKQSAADFAFSLTPSRSNLHVCAIRQSDLSQILHVLNGHYLVRTVTPLAPLVLEACRRGTQGSPCVLHEPDSLTVALPDREAGLMLATTAGATHAVVFKRLLAAHPNAMTDIELISVPSVQTGLGVGETRAPILHGWLRRHERRQHDA